MSVVGAAATITEATVAAAPAVSIEEIWRETAEILDTQPAPGGLLALPAPSRSQSFRLEIEDDADVTDVSGRQIASHSAEDLTDPVPVPVEFLVIFLLRHSAGAVVTVVVVCDVQL